MRWLPWGSKASVYLSMLKVRLCDGCALPTLRMRSAQLDWEDALGVRGFMPLGVGVDVEPECVDEPWLVADTRPSRDMVAPSK